MKRSSFSRHALYAFALIVIGSFTGCAGAGGGGALVSSPTNAPPPNAVGSQVTQPVANAVAVPSLVQKSNGAPWSPTIVTVSYGTQPAAGDVLVVLLHNNGNTSGGANTYTAPSGWTQIDVDSSHSYETYQAFYHVAGALEPKSYGFTPACGCKQHVWNAFEFSGVNGTTPIDQHAFAFRTSVTTWNTPSETPSQAGDLALVAMLPVKSGLTWSNAAGWTVDIATETWSGEVLQELVTSTSPVSESSTLSSSSTYGYAAIVLLNPGTIGTSPSPSPSPSTSPSPGAKVDWPTWGMKATRNSYNPVEKTLTTSNVGTLHQIWHFTTGGVITAAPVIAANVSVPTGGTRDILYVGDHHANFYALDANTGAQVWSATKQTTFVDPTKTVCNDQPGGLYGIGGSATIDRQRGTVYFVDGPGNLYGYDLATSTQKAGPAAMYPLQNGVNITNDYGALNEDINAGVIYVPAGAHCGMGTYGGVDRYSIASGAVAHFYTEGGPPNLLGGVWGPGGVTIDPRSTSNPAMNNIFFVTGDGAVGTGKYPFSAVRLTEALGVVSANAPNTSLSGDWDFGDSPLVITPSSSSGCGRTLVIAEAKTSITYVWDADNIAAGPLQSFHLGSADQNGQNIGTAAYDPTTNMVFMPNGSDAGTATPGMPSLHHGLIAFTVTSSCQLAFVWQQPVGPNQVHDGPPAPPTVANGVVYYSDGIGTAGCSPIGTPSCSGSADFYAFNETSGATLLHLTFPVGLFTAPVVVNGKVYLTTWNGVGPGIVYALGL